MVTDYDCWHEEEGDVTVETVLATLRANNATGQKAVLETIRRLSADPDLESHAWNALEGALITDPSAVPASAIERLAPIVGKYLGGES